MACDNVHRVSKRQLNILLKARLLVIAAASNLFRKFERILWRKHRRRLSLLRFMDYLAAGPKPLMRVLDPAADPPEPASLEKALAKYC